MIHTTPRRTKLLIPVFCAMTFILGFEIGGLQLALLRAAVELNLEGAMLGLPITAQFIAISFTPLIFGPISDRVGKKKVITAFMLVFILGSVLTGLPGSAALFLLGLFIIGAGYSVCECSITAAISDIFEEKGEKYINLSQSFMCVGAAMSPLLLQGLMDRFSVSWRVSFFICAAAMAAILPVFFLAYPHIAAKVTERTEQKPTQKQMGKPLALFALVVCMFVYVGIESGIAAFADTVFTLELGAPQFGAYAIALFWLSMGVGRFVFGRMRRIPRYATTISLFCVSVILLGLAFGRQELMVLGLFAVSGLACSCIWPGIAAAAVARNRGASGRAMGLLNLGAGLGGAILPLAMSVIMDMANVFLSFFVLAILSLAAGIYMWRMNPGDME